MKLLSFRPPRARVDHFGVLLSNGLALDITEAKSGRGLADSLIECIRGGADALARVREVLALAEERLKAGSSEHIVALDAVTAPPPCSPARSWLSARTTPTMRPKSAVPPTRAQPALSSTWTP